MGLPQAAGCPPQHAPLCRVAHSARRPVFARSAARHEAVRRRGGALRSRLRSGARPRQSLRWEPKQALAVRGRGVALQLRSPGRNAARCAGSARPTSRGAGGGAASAAAARPRPFAGCSQSSRRDLRAAPLAQLPPPRPACAAAHARNALAHDAHCTTAARAQPAYSALRCRSRTPRIPRPPPRRRTRARCCRAPPRSSPSRRLPPSGRLSTGRRGTRARRGAPPR